jgi:hypothetical protein
MAQSEQPTQVDRRGREDEIDRHGVERLGELADLAVSVPHRRQERLEVRVAGERRGERPDRVGPRVDQLGRTEATGGHHARAVGHPAVRERGPVLHDRDPSPGDLSPLEPELRAGLDDRRARVERRDVAPDLIEPLGRRGVDLVDDHHIGRTQVGLPWVIAQLVTGSQRIDDDDEEVRAVEREIVVAAIPQDDVRLGLGRPQDLGVVHPGVHHSTGVEVGLVLLALLDRRPVEREVLVRREALDPLALEVAVGHRVAHDHDAQAPLLEEDRDPAGRLALACAGARRADRDDRTPAGQHRPARAEQDEVRAGGEGTRRGVHDVLVADVAVGEHHGVGALVADHPLELLLGDDGDAGRVARAGQRRRVVTVGDPGDLRRGERHHPDRGVVAVDGVEIVEVAACRTHDHDAFHGAQPAFRDTEAGGRRRARSSGSRGSAAGGAASSMSARRRSTRSSPSSCLRKVAPTPSSTASRRAAVLQ